MPKSHLLKKWIATDGHFTTDGRVVFCQACSKEVKCEQKSHLEQHKSAGAHMASVARRNKSSSNSKQTFISSTVGRPEDNFNFRLCQALVSANVPWNVLSNLTLKTFLGDISGHSIPNESTLRKNYLDPVYQKTLDEIREDIGDHYIWCSVDETSDSCGRFIVNVVVGKLDQNEPGNPHLILCKEIEQTNNSTIACAVRDALRILWPAENQDSKFLLLVTDSAAYMLKAGQVLQSFYPSMLHVTCLAHGLHRLAEEIRSNFSDVNSVVSSVKKVFLKAPTRTQLFKEKLPATPLPPEPILTRWGTWLSAAIYYAEHLEGIKNVVNDFDETEASCIAKAKKSLECPTLVASLAYIKTHFCFIPEAILQLESATLPLKDSLDIIGNVSRREIPGPLGEACSSKLQKILQCNPGFEDMKVINSVLQGEKYSGKLPLQPAALASMYYAPMTSCSVERTFSSYKNVLRDNRKSFTPHNLGMYVVIYCNTKK